VICWELLTRRSFFGEAANVQQVLAMLEGDILLPTEVPLSLDVQEGLGDVLFRRSVLGMLQRDPSERPAVRDLLAIWLDTFHLGGRS
jgi:hypothetical protein